MKKPINPIENTLLLIDDFWCNNRIEFVRNKLSSILFQYREFRVGMIYNENNSLSKSVYMISPTGFHLKEI